MAPTDTPGSCCQRALSRPQDVLVLDVRSYQDYCAKRIKSAHHVDVIPKRSKSPLQALRNFAKKDDSPGTINVATAEELVACISGQGQQLFQSREVYEIVVYGYDSAATSIAMQVAQLLVTDEVKPCAKVIVVEGGLSKFAELNPDLLDSSNSPSSRGRANSPTEADEQGIAPAPDPYFLFSPKQKADPPTEITSYLYLGSYRNACNEQTLEALGINCILNVATECDKELLPVNEQWLYKQIHLTDDADQEIVPSFPEAFSFIDRARKHNRAVLVHCRMGVSRSATIVIGYLMKSNRWSLEEAFEFVKARRPIIGPNYGFMQQLAMYERSITKQSSQAILQFYEIDAKQIAQAEKLTRSPDADDSRSEAVARASGGGNGDGGSKGRRHRKEKKQPPTTSVSPPSSASSG